MGEKTVRGIRGATTVQRNDAGEIVAATRELLEALTKANDITVPDICSAIFSVTTDLNAQFPAVAAREIGWLYTPLLCTNEIPVPGSLKKCIRVLLHVNTRKKQDEVIHIYLRDAKKLRPDLGSPKQDIYYNSS
ncbi:MAG: chorismate mutase [Planctomycetota bacterium]